MKILLIDDDSAAMRYYIGTLREEGGYEVEHARDPDDALICLSESGASYSLVILDSMMPPGKAYENEDTNEGLATGKCLFRHIRKEFPNLPILVLTNLSILGWFQPTAIAKPALRELRKIDVDPFDLVTTVRQMIHQNTSI